MIFNDCLTEKEEIDRLADYTVEALEAALNKTAAKGEIKHGFHIEANELLCGTKTQAEVLADFFEDLGFDEVRTGYYDPEIDKRNNEVDEYTGLYYVAWG